jgi:GR25 family glycosyltransferase involved in LPS biosynthesis
MNYNDIFKYTSVINLDVRMDRWNECCDEFGRIGASMSEVNRFSAIPNDTHGAIGCGFSHALALTQFLIKSDEQYCLILEDDFKFKEDIGSVISDINYFLTTVSDWQVLLLSGNAVKTISGSTNRYLKVISSLTTAAYIVKRTYAPRLIEKFLFGAEKLKTYIPIIPPYSWGTLLELYAADSVWQDLQKEDNWFILNPAPVIQRASYSNIMLQNVDYKV